MKSLRSFSSFSKGRLALSKLRDKATIDDEISHVNLVFPDQYGRLSGMKISAEHFLDVVDGKNSDSKTEPSPYQTPDPTPSPTPSSTPDASQPTADTPEPPADTSEPDNKTDGEEKTEPEPEGKLLLRKKKKNHK